MGWSLFNKSKSKNVAQVSHQNNQPIVSQESKSSTDLAVDALVADDRFKYSLKSIRQRIDQLKKLRLKNTEAGFMLKCVKKDIQFNTGCVSVYTRIDYVHPRLLQKLRNNVAGRTADERISIEDEIIGDISALSVEAFREIIDPDFLCDYLEPYNGDWNQDSYELNFLEDVFMPEGSLTVYQIYKAYAEALKNE